MPVIFDSFDVDIPFTNPNPPYGQPTGLPLQLESPGLPYYAYPIGGWNTGYRGSVYIKFKSDAASEKTINLSFDNGDADDAVLPAGEETVAVMSAEELLTDFDTIIIGGNSEYVQILGIQLVPFSAEVFWTAPHGVTEIV